MQQIQQRIQADLKKIQKYSKEFKGLKINEDKLGSSRELGFKKCSE